MLATDLYSTIQAMPKIDLHRHLEGSLRLETIVEIARENQMDMPAYTAEEIRPFVQMVAGEPRTWRNFLAKFGVLRQFFLSPEVIRRITYETIADAANDNVKYLELRFTPNALCFILDCPQIDAVGWVCDATDEAVRQHDIDVRLIVSMNRHESLDSAAMTTEAAIAYQDRGVVGLDLAGREFDRSSKPFYHLFQQARAAGLFVTIHAGEWAGPESVWDVLNNFELERIGHGVRGFEDKRIADVLIERGITLEVCPSSNYDSGVVQTFGSHPLPKIISRGVKATINTDDPIVSDLTLTEELYRSISRLSLSLEDVKRQTMLAAQEAFLPLAEKQALIERFAHWLDMDSALPST